MEFAEAPRRKKVEAKPLQIIGPNGRRDVATRGVVINPFANPVPKTVPASDLITRLRALGPYTPIDPEVGTMELDIYKNMRRVESAIHMRVRQRQIDMTTRRDLIYSMISAYGRLSSRVSISIEGLYRSVGIFDRVFSRQILDRGRLGDVVVACLVLGLRVETRRIGLRSVLSASGSDRKEEVIQAANWVWKVLDYETTSWPTSFWFMTFYSGFLRVSRECEIVGRYICEIVLASPDFFDQKPSLQGAVSICLARLLFTPGEEAWPAQMRVLTESTETELAPFVVRALELVTIDIAEKSPIFVKYGQGSFGKILRDLRIPEVLPEPFSPSVF